MGVKNWQKFIGEPESLIDSSESGEDGSRKSRWVGKKHIRAVDLKKELGGEVWNSYFKFAFVRNPWDRVVSTYLHRRKVANDLVKRVWPESRFLFNAALAIKYDAMGCSSVQQKEYITDDSSNTIVDFIGRFEDLEKDFRSVCDRIGVRSHLGGKHDPTSEKSYKYWYNKRGKDIVSRVKNDDIRRFNYTFE